MAQNMAVINKPKTSLAKHLYKNRWLYLMCIPGLAFLIIPVVEIVKLIQRKTAK